MKQHKISFCSWYLVGGTCDASLVMWELGGLLEVSETASEIQGPPGSLWNPQEVLEAVMAIPFS